MVSGQQSRHEIRFDPHDRRFVEEGVPFDVLARIRSEQPVYRTPSGAWYLARSGNLGGALALGMGSDPVNYYQLVIGVGAWLGTIMLLNVWGLIWPNQKKILGIVPASDEEKAKARKVAMLASRANFVLSVPMLLCMGSATHGLPF